MKGYSCRCSCLNVMKTRLASAIPPPARLRAGAPGMPTPPVWCGGKGLFRADPPAPSPKNAPKVRRADLPVPCPARQTGTPAYTTGAVRGKAAPAASERRPSFSAFFLGEQEKGRKQKIWNEGKRVIIRPPPLTPPVSPQADPACLPTPSTTRYSCAPSDTPKGAAPGTSGRSGTPPVSSRRSSAPASPRPVHTSPGVPRPA